MKSIALALLLLAAPLAAADFRIEHYTFETNSDGGTFTVNRGTYTETWDAINSLNYECSFTSGNDTFRFNGVIPLVSRRSLPSAAAIRNLIQSDVQARGFAYQANAFALEASENRKRTGKTGVVGSVVGQTVTVP